MRWLLLIFFGCSIFPASAQLLYGVVHDERGVPLPGAQVYFDGTATGAITDDNGRYEIHAAKPINATLIISMLGYEDYQIAHPFQSQGAVFRLKPAENALPAVNVTGEGMFSREQKLRVFREQFLGTTTAGRSCKIQNEEALSFFYDKSKNQLQVYASEPLEIHNTYLGYDIVFSVHQIGLNFIKRSIESADISHWSISGTTFYKDLTQPGQTFLPQRRKSFEGSQAHFFKQLLAGKLSGGPLRLLRNNQPCRVSDYFEISAEGARSYVVLKNASGTTPTSFEMKFGVTQQDLYSEVTFYTNQFSVDQFGNHDALQSISFSGAMAQKRIGDLLPSDFEPR